MKKVFLALLFVGILPSLAFATTSLNTFTGPLDDLMGLLSGSLARVIVVCAVCITAYQLIVNSEDLSGSTRKMLYIVLAASIIAAAGAFANLFDFTGALI